MPIFQPPFPCTLKKNLHNIAAGLSSSTHAQYDIVLSYYHTDTVHNTVQGLAMSLFTQPRCLFTYRQFMNLSRDRLAKI